MNALQALTARFTAAATNPPRLGSVQITRRRPVRPATDSYGRRRPAVRQSASAGRTARQRALQTAVLDAATQAKQALRP